jgi:hypothetical protein
MGRALNEFGSSADNGRVMKKVVTRIAPWQAGKTLALIYLALGLLKAAAMVGGIELNVETRSDA